MIGSTLTDPLMQSFLIVVIRVFLDHSLQMLPIMDEDMCEAFPSQTAHEPFANSIGARCSMGRLQPLDA